MLTGIACLDPQGTEAQCCTVARLVAPSALEEGEVTTTTVEVACCPANRECTTSLTQEVCVCPPPHWSPQCNPGKALHSNGLGGPLKHRDASSQARLLGSRLGPKISTIQATSIGNPCMGNGMDEHEKTQEIDKAPESPEARPCKIPLFQHGKLLSMSAQFPQRARLRAASVNISLFNRGSSEVAAVIPRQDDSEGHACTIPSWPSQRPGRGFFRSEPSRESTTSCLCLVSDSLEQLVVPGDVLVVQGHTAVGQVGVANGPLGQLLLVAATPKSIWQHSAEAHKFRTAWPPGDVPELWKVRTLSVRRQRDLCIAEMLLYVETGTGRFKIAGEITEDLAIAVFDSEAVELWQSPTELRQGLRRDLVADVLEEMNMEAKKLHRMTRSVNGTSVKPRLYPVRAGTVWTLEDVQSSWKSDFICTSAVIVFWQRYLCKLARAGRDLDPGDQRRKEVELVCRWMPPRVDGGLPQQLLESMRRAGWAKLSQKPLVPQTQILRTTGSQAPHGGSSHAPWTGRLDDRPIWLEAKPEAEREDALGRQCRSKSLTPSTSMKQSL